MPARAAGEAESRPGLLQNAARQFPVRFRPRSAQVLLWALIMASATPTALGKAHIPQRWQTVRLQ